MQDVIEEHAGGDRVQDVLLSLEEEVRPFLERTRDLPDERIRGGFDRRHALIISRLPIGRTRVL